MVNIFPGSGTFRGQNSSRGAIACPLPNFAIPSPDYVVYYFVCSFLSGVILVI